MSSVLYCYYRSVKRQLFNQDSQYRQGQLKKNKRSDEIFSFQWSQGLVPRTVHTKGPSIVCGTSPRDWSHEFKQNMSLKTGIMCTVGRHYYPNDVASCNNAVYHTDSFGLGWGGSVVVKPRSFVHKIMLPFYRETKESKQNCHDVKNKSHA